MKKHFFQDALPQGATIVRGPNECSRYPQAEVEIDSVVDNIAGHRTGTGFTLSKILDFRQIPNPEVYARVRGAQNFAGLGKLGAGWRNQQSLAQYYMEHMHDQIEPGDCLVLIVIPPCYDLQTIYWQNYCEVEGLEMTIRLQGADIDVATLTGDDLSCGFYDVPAAHRIRTDVNEIIEVCFNAIPPVNSDNCERPVRHGGLAESAFLVSAGGRCISSGR